MLSDATAQITPAQEMRLWREEEKARKLRQRVEAAARSIVADPMRFLWPHVGNEALLVLEVMIEEWLQTCPQHCGTRAAVALHEAAHLVTAKALGFAPWRAEIYGSPGLLDGWGGGVDCERNPLSEASLSAQSFTADDVRNEAALRLVGPAAEQILGQKAVVAFRSELIEACLCAAKLAEMKGIGRKQALVEILILTAALIFEYRDEISELSTILSKRKSIRPSDSAVARILGRVKENDVSRLPEPSKYYFKQAASLIAASPICLAALVKRVVP